MLKLNIGFSKKLREANYGSRGASVHIDLETESGLIDQPERLKDRIRQLFKLAKASVGEELNGHGAPTSNGANGSQAEANGTGHSNGRRRDGTRRATTSQVRALHAIAQRQQLDVTNLVQSRYGVDKPEQLSITEASELIDSLKASGNGNGGHR